MRAENPPRPSQASRDPIAHLGDRRDDTAESAGAIRDRIPDQPSRAGNLLERGFRSVLRSGYDLLSGDLDPENALFDPSEGTTVVEPRRDRTGYWAGALAPFRDGDGDIYLCYRLRDPDERGRRAVVARTGDTGAETEEVWSVDRGEIGARSIEGGTLYERDGVYRLYLSYQSEQTKRWKVMAVPGDSVGGLDADRAEDIEAPTGIYTNTKDPFVYDDDLYLYASTPKFLSEATFEVDLSRPGHDDARRIAVADSAASSTRLTSIFPTETAEIALYDWKRSIVFTGEEKSRFGALVDSSVVPLLGGGRSFLSPHGSRSLRYVRALPVDDEIWFYYEMSMPGGGHRTCVYRASRADVESTVGRYLDG